MKNGKRLTREEKKFLQNNGVDPTGYLRVKKLADSYVFLNRKSGKVLDIRR